MFIYIFLIIVCQWSNAEVLINTIAILNETEMTTIGILETINQNTTSVVISTNPPSKAIGWWLFAILISTVIVAISIGVIHYYRRQIPCRRFLQNWRSRDNDDNDHIILQIERPSIINNQRLPWISFT